jgi:flagella basal body P-ring formation protein FlgA
MRLPAIPFGGVVYALLLAALMLAVAASALPSAWAASENEAAEGPAMPVTLHPYVQIEDEYIRLGDIFDPVTRYADRIVARAPDPGGEMTLPAVWLWKAAKTFGVDWKPTSAAETVTVVRPSTMVTAEQVETLLRDEFFIRTGQDDLIELETDGAPLRIHLPRTASPTVRLDRFELDPRSGRFTATVVAPAEGRPLHRANVAGVFHRMVEMPVPSRRLGAEHIIRAEDIEMVRLREKGLGANLIVDPARLIGQAVQRSLPAGQPIRMGAVHPPILVEKGRIVTVTLETDAMVLTVQGRAMERGAEGDVIRVQNTLSNAIIEATVERDGGVVVHLNTALAMQTQ